MNTVERLIDFFVPSHYDLVLKINESDKTFEGAVTISGQSPADNQSVKLHAKDLIITGASIDQIPATFEFGEHDELKIIVDDSPAGNHTVIVNFTGTITENMHGLYPCYYNDGGVQKIIYATQFESHHAREVFPCIDEPAAKATFSLSLTTSSNQTVLSNMPVKMQTINEGHLITSFETTPRMSTYLLAFAIGDLQKKSSRTKNGVEVNVYATIVQPEGSLDFALDIATRAIDFYDDYFGTPYPLPKSDHIALPDFSSGAMENWGLITYRESTLLADPRNTSIASKHYVATVIAHELAHMWFGNLVTMQWWNDLWLNESFATMMEYIAIDALHPEWNIWLDFVTNESVMALRRDSLDGVQSVQVDVNHPDEISTLFDGAIVYAKGARLMRMIQHYIGHDAFRVGLKKYFSDHAYGNTVGNDLWTALEKASGKQIASIMNTWISQPGYPVVTAVRDDEHITLSQRQFFIGPHDQSDSQWPIPLDSNDAGAPKLMDSRQISWQSKDPIRLNMQDSAHFITHYDDVSRQRLIDQVSDGTLDTIGRVQLLDESTLLVRGGLMTTAELLPLIQAYRYEKLEHVWDIISLALAELRKFVESDKQAETKLRQLCAWMAKDQYERLGWHSKEAEPEEDTKLRSTIIGLTLYGEVPEALEKAKMLYESTPLEKLDPELRALIISSVARYDDGKVVDDLLARYANTQSPDLKQDICIGITSTRVPEKISLLLDSMKDTKVIKPQDVFRWFVFLIRSRDSRDLAWQWIRNNWDWVEKTFSGDKSYDDFPRYSATGLVTREQLEEYKEFFGPKKNIPALSRVINLGIGEIEGRVEIIEKDGDGVIDALRALDLK